MAKNSTEYYLKHAKKNGMDVTYGAKHIKVSGKDPTGTKSTMIIPHKLKGDGTERAIIKWFERMGIPIALIAFILFLVSII